MGTIVFLQEVVDALEIATDEMSSYVNGATGQVITLTHEELRLAEMDPVPYIPEWQQELVSEARQVLESEDWIRLPDKFDIHEWEIMDRFGQSLTKASEREEIDDAIHGAGAFRHFKSTIRRLGIEQAWFAYRLREIEAIAREWLADHGLQAGVAEPAVEGERGSRLCSDPRR